MGQIAEGVKNTGFTTFLLFYYNSVLRLSGTYAGTALLIALVFDAVTDPLVGSLSDSFKHRLGRRHPFMYASAIPLAVSFGLIFSPPEGLGQIGLFLWLTRFAILVRASMTLYHVPHMALGAELTSDYHERIIVVAYRPGFGALALRWYSVWAGRSSFPMWTDGWAVSIPKPIDPSDGSSGRSC